eukprot:scaffold13207_cov143-Cylindrotheca_fusiformis.AAC.12
MQQATNEKESLQLSAAPTWKNRLTSVISAVGIIVFCVLLPAKMYDLWAYPILIAASACWLLLEEVPALKGVTSLPPLDSQRKHSRFARYLINDNNHGLHLLTTLIIIIPCSVFTVRVLSKHMAKEGIDFHKGVANGLGKVGLAAMSFFLIPVSKHSVLLEASGIGSIHAVRLHTWAGFFAILGGLGHGLYYYWIWLVVQNFTEEELAPGDECWVKGYDKDCYDKFINVTGVYAGKAITLLALTSLYWVRRNYYRLFYVTHVSCSVILLISLTMHYNKTILYLAPSLLYYIATNVPLCVEAIKKWYQGGNSLSKVIHIPDSGGCVDISLRMPDLIDAPCGKYVRLSVPEISLKSHPFTVFSHPDHPEDGIVIFRPFKGFTSKLSTRLKKTASSTKKQFPKLVIVGVHTGTNQLQQALQHDTIVIVAGGVGIVTYMSLLSSLLSLNADLGDTKTKRSGIQKQRYVHVHWACRDEGLIQHIMNCYLLPLQKRSESHFSSLSITFTVHHTGRDSPTKEKQENGVGNSQMSSRDSGVPVSSVFEVGKSTKRNIFPALTFSAIAWGGLVIVNYCYYNVQSSENVETRSTVVVALSLWSIVLSLVSLFTFGMASRFHSKIFYTKLESSTKEIECAAIVNGTTRETSDAPTAETVLREDMSNATERTEKEDKSETESLNETEDILREDMSNATERTEKEDKSETESLNETEDMSDTTERTESLNETLSFHHSRGRPDFATIIEDGFKERASIESNNDIGIFACGPPLFSESIRIQCDKMQASAKSANRPVVIYEEVYDM